MPGEKEFGVEYETEVTDIQRPLLYNTQHSKETFMPQQDLNL
jgi:hypothetical protein